MKFLSITPRTRARIAIASASLLMALGASAQSNPLVKGPNPTMSSVQADGPFALSTQQVRGSGFGGGTVYTPTAAGQYGLIAVCPGFVSPQSSIAALSRRMASHGFVVVAIDTSTPLDLPGTRSNELMAALRATAALTTGPVAGKIDASRMAVAGWSMGGGGTVLAVGKNPSLKGGVAWAPFATNNDLGDSKVPLAIMGGSSDTVAAAGTFATVFYNAMPRSTPKLLGIVRGAGHGEFTTSSNPTAYTSVSWVKRFMDNDARYSQFLGGDSRFSTFQSSGPF